jgi:alternate signal-mediated exported protein
MNKIVKGSIAGAAGIALLLGGAGTFALWNSTANLSAHTITAGKLTLSDNGDGVWKNGTTTINPTTYRVIPGQTLVYTQTLKVDAVGDGIKAKLTYSGLTPAGALATYTTEALEVTSSSTNAVVSGSTINFTSGTATVNVKVTIVFPDTVTGSQGQAEELNLNALAFTLEQTL